MTSRYIQLLLEGFAGQLRRFSTGKSVFAGIAGKWQSSVSNSLPTKKQTVSPTTVGLANSTMATVSSIDQCSQKRALVSLAMPPFVLLFVVTGHIEAVVASPGDARLRLLAPGSTTGLECGEPGNVAGTSLLSCHHRLHTHFN